MMAVLVSMSMRDGFSQYVLQAEINRLTPLEQALAQAYDPDNPGWPALVTSRTAWQDFVVRNFRPEAPPWQPGVAIGARPPGPPPAFAPRELSDRIFLFDAQGDILIGRIPPKTNFAKRPILPVPNDVDDSTTRPVKPIGWLGMASPTGGGGPADVIFLEGQTRSLLLASIAAIALSLIAAFVLAQQFLAPVRQLAKGANALADGRFATRIDHDRQDELGSLTDDFNSLAENLENMEKAERQWVSNASHELQTPVSVLRAEIEALQDGIRTPDSKTLASLHASVMRLADLVGDLNSLARSQEGYFEIGSQQYDLSGLVKEAADRAKARIHADGLVLTLDLEPGIAIACDPMKIGQLLDNLLENSRRYTEAPGQISVRTVVCDDGAELVIEDTAPAPNETAMPQLFKRFYREETSRSRLFGGSGLGLAICKIIVETHRGEIHASVSGLGGLRIDVRLPLHPTRSGRSDNG